MTAKPLFSAWPEQVELVLTNRCNRRCKYCYISCARRREKELSTANWLEIIQRLADAKVMGLILSGGEPLSRPDFPDLLDKIHNLPFRYHIITNGFRMTEDIVETIAAKKRCTNVQISLDGPEHIHDQARGRGAYAEAVKAFQLLRQAGVFVTLKATIGTHNFSCLNEMFDHLCEQLDAPAVELNYVSDAMGQQVGLKLPVQAFKPTIDAVIAAIGRYPGKIRRSGLWTTYQEWQSIIRGTCSHKKRTCSRSCHGFVIMPDGAVMPCSMLNGKYTLGNAMDTDFVEMWRNHTILQELRTWKQPEKCNNCPWQDRCPGTCPAQDFYCYKEFLEAGGSL